MALADIVNVVVTKASSSVSRQGFGTPLFAAYHSHWSERVRTYSAASALATMVQEGFATTDSAYKGVAAALAQNPRVRTLKIGRRNTSWNQTVKITPSAVNSTVYNGTVNGLPWTFTSDNSATLAEVCTGIAAVIEALAGVTAVGTSGTEVVVSTTAVGVTLNFLHGTGAGVYTIADATVDTGVETDLNLIRAADKDWYGLGLDNPGQPAIEAAAAWAQTQLIVFGCSSADDAIKASTADNLLENLQALSLTRTFFVFNKNYDSYAGFAALCGGLPYEPGAYDFYAKTVRGVAVSSELSETEQDNITDQGGNVFVTLGGKNVVLYGVTPSGDFLDDTISIDWIQSRVTEDVWSLISSAPKLPYTDESVDRLRGAVLGVLLLGVRRGVLANDPAPTVDAPRVADVSDVDRANRHLPDVVGFGRLAGAIHTVDIAITVSV